MLGITFDCGLNFRKQPNALEKTKTRRALLARVAGSTWGPVSLVRYGSVLVGLGLFERGLSSLEAGVPNIAARRITGIGRSARFMALRAAAGMISIHDLFNLNCALSFHLALRARNSSIRDALLAWLPGKWIIDKLEAVRST